MRFIELWLSYPDFLNWRETSARCPGLVRLDSNAPLSARSTSNPRQIPTFDGMLARLKS